MTVSQAANLLTSLMNSAAGQQSLPGQTGQQQTTTIGMNSVSAAQTQAQQAALQQFLEMQQQLTARLPAQSGLQNLQGGLQGNAGVQANQQQFVSLLQQQFANSKLLSSAAGGVGPGTIGAGRPGQGPGAGQGITPQLLQAAGLAHSQQNQQQQVLGLQNLQQQNASAQVLLLQAQMGQACNFNNFSLYLLLIDFCFLIF